MHIHVIQHVAFESPGLIETELKSRGHSFSFIHQWRGDVLPRIDEISGLVVMGGPMSANDDARLTWLKREKDLVANMIEQKKPVLGVCLGAQIIASVLGARIYANKDKEIGWYPVTWTAEGRRYEGSPVVFHWHGETFDLPSGAVHLARSVATENQAFRFEEHVLGLQFHPEVTAEIIEGLLSACREELEPNQPYIQSEEVIRSFTIPQSRECLFGALEIFEK